MNKAPELIDALRAEIRNAAPAELPSLCGQIAEVDAELRLRLSAAHPGAMSADGCDRLLDVDEVAAVLGMSSRWVRDHQNELPRVNLPGSAVRFSSQRLAAWVKQRSYC